MKKELLLTQISKGLIASLLYLIASKPDILFSVYMCERYQSNPKESPYKLAKRILKYLKRTINVGLWCPSDASLNLVSFLDYDFVGCKFG